MRHYESYLSSIPTRASRCPRWSALSLDGHHPQQAKYHRLEDWSRRQLPPSPRFTRPYVLMNMMRCADADRLIAFKFNDAVLRHLIVAMSEAAVTPSPMMKEEKSRSLSPAGSSSRAISARRCTRSRAWRNRRRQLRRHQPEAGEGGGQLGDARRSPAGRAARCTHARRRAGARLRAGA